MADYIDREEYCEKHCRCSNEYCDKESCPIWKAPAANVAPVVHNYWESYDCSQYMGTDEYGEPKWRDGKFYICHNRRCRRKTVVKSLYCPNCGAKMDGGANRDT